MREGQEPDRVVSMHFCTMCGVITQYKHPTLGARIITLSHRLDRRVPMSKLACVALQATTSSPP